MVPLSLLRELANNTTTELTKAATGVDSSLSFIKHPLPMPTVTEGEQFQIIVIGGSICRKALAIKQGSAVSLFNKQEFSQPAFLTEDLFLQFLKEHIYDGISKVALNFAYPLSPFMRNNILDGVLLTGTKENIFENLVGKAVGETIEQYFLQIHNREISVSIANDVICLLFSGLQLSSYSNLACGIVGTGVNFALFDDEMNAVNLESANFSSFPISNEAEFIDAHSSSPKKALFEKEIAGAYLYQHFNLILERESPNHPRITSTKELKEQALSATSPFATVAYTLLEKSSSYVAAHIAGIANYKKNDLVFIMEGGFFWGDTVYKELVELYLQHLTEYKITIKHITDSPYIGAAFLV